MLAVDLPVALLVIGVLALAASAAFPTLPIRLRRRPDRTSPRRAAEPRTVVEATYRRVITGRPALLPATTPFPVVEAPSTPPQPTPAPPADDPAATTTGPRRESPDGHDRHRDRPDIAAAKAVIDHYFDTDPQRMANLLKRWIDDDRPGAAHR